MQRLLPDPKKLFRPQSDHGVALADEGYDPEFGARPVKRVIHRLVLNRLSKDILAQTVDKSKPIVIDAVDGELKFTNS